MFVLLQPFLSCMISQSLNITAFSNVYITVYPSLRDSISQSVQLLVCPSVRNLLPFHSVPTAAFPKSAQIASLSQTADIGQPTLFISLDLSTVFDTIDHKVLISRLTTFSGMASLELPSAGSHPTYMVILKLFQSASQLLFPPC